MESNEKIIIQRALEVINQLNKELQQSNIINLNYLLFKISNLKRRNNSINKIDLITEVDKILIYYSETFRILYYNKAFSNVYIFINYYIENIIDYYDSLMMTNQDKFDRYVEINNGNIPKKKIIKSEDLFMTMDDVQNAMQLLNEAVRNYYEIYFNKSLFATFTDSQVIQFRIKESELSHLLGVNLREIVNNPTYVDIFHITPEEIEYLNDTTYTLDPDGSAAITVLHKIIDLHSGNLLQVEEDRLRKIYGYKYASMEYKSAEETLKKYAKINMRSKAFISFKPLEELSLALNFPRGYNLIRAGKNEDNQHSLLISKNHLSEKFKYSTLVANFDSLNDRRYFQSLFLRTPDEFGQLQKDAIPSITTKVELISDDSSGGVGKTFTVAEQIAFLKEVLSDFKNLNSEELIAYFSQLTDEYQNSHGKSK